MKPKQIKDGIYKSGMTQKELAAKLETSPQNLNGKIARGSFDDDELEELADLMEVRYVCRFEKPNRDEEMKLQAQADILAKLAKDFLTCKKGEEQAILAACFNEINEQRKVLLEKGVTEMDTPPIQGLFHFW